MHEHIKTITKLRGSQARWRLGKRSESDGLGTRKKSITGCLVILGCIRMMIKSSIKNRTHIIEASAMISLCFVLKQSM
ncbi:hypothetical protein HanXRQr2_Chr08g0338761 [Helianthus annuus]|uniref:Uncharacterized protein n=1 Tax=Helianthus annuus TaxID=4232 RepID=A0A251TCH5_HELAN|nr:hypothetical protein HanXRQr2_Chr08g0338761 [Helianthus annuus]